MGRRIDGQKVTYSRSQKKYSGMQLGKCKNCDSQIKAAISQYSDDRMALARLDDRNEALRPQRRFCIYKIIKVAICDLDIVVW